MVKLFESLCWNLFTCTEWYLNCFILRHKSPADLIRSQRGHNLLKNPRQAHQLDLPQCQSPKANRTEPKWTQLRSVEWNCHRLFCLSVPFQIVNHLLLPHRSSAVGLTSPFWSFGVRSTRGHVACSLGINCSTRSYFWIRRNAQLTFPNAN